MRAQFDALIQVAQPDANVFGGVEQTHGITQTGQAGYSARRARASGYFAMEPTSLSQRSSSRLRSADVPYLAKS